MPTLPGAVGPTPMMFTAIIPPPARYRISGILRDSVGAIVAEAQVDIFETASRAFRGTTTSDANGAYSLDVTSSETGLAFFAVFYLAGSPDIAGTTVNTLTGS